MHTIDDIRAEFDAILARPARAPTFEQARAWLWTAADARERRERALAAGDLDLCEAFRKLGDRLEIAAELDRDALAAAALNAREAHDAALGIGR